MSPTETAQMLPTALPPHGDEAARPVRVTIVFSSDSGRQYLYDDQTGAIFPWNDRREAALTDLLANEASSTPERCVDSDDVAIIRRFRKAYGAFARPNALPPLPAPQVPYRDYASFISKVLVLTVTEDCNLRCRYCIYSGHYDSYHSYSAKHMTPERARHAIDWYMNIAGPQLRLTPSKRFGMTFYGGEPLLNVPAIRAALEHASALYPNRFINAMTTNGTLLTREVVDLLAEHDVHVTVSLDGPEDEHNRLRVNRDNHGTWKTVMTNLQRIRNDHPSFWRANMTTACVFDWRTDLLKTAAFFDAERDVVPPPILVNPVSAKGTYYSNFTRADYVRHTAMMDELRGQYKAAKITDAPVSRYVTFLVGFPMILLFTRSRLGDSRDPALPFSGSCFPGMKLSVGVDGTVDICERVNGSMPLGHVSERHLREAAVTSLLCEYRKAVLPQCPACPVSKLCQVCFSAAEGNGTMLNVSGLCNTTLQTAKRNLKTYVSILEQNPRANFSAEADPIVLQTRFVLYS